MDDDRTRVDDRTTEHTHVSTDRTTTRVDPGVVVARDTQWRATTFHPINQSINQSIKKVDARTDRRESWSVTRRALDADTNDIPSGFDGLGWIERARNDVWVAGEWRRRHRNKNVAHGHKN